MCITNTNLEYKLFSDFTFYCKNPHLLIQRNEAGRVSKLLYSEIAFGGHSGNKQISDISKQVSSPLLQKLVFKTMKKKIITGVIPETDYVQTL